MDYIVSSLLSFLLLYKYVSIFLIIFVAGMLLPLPANTLLLATGTFASQGYFNVWICFFVALTANVLGDCVGYSITRIWGEKFVKREHWSKIGFLKNIEHFIKNYPGLTIVVTRFMGIIGTAVNFLAGLSEVPLGKFLVYDIIGNTLSIGLFLGLGYVLGTYSEQYSDIGSIIDWIVVIIIAIVVIRNVFLKKKLPKTK